MSVSNKKKVQIKEILKNREFKMIFLVKIFF